MISLTLHFKADNHRILLIISVQFLITRICQTIEKLFLEAVFNTIRYNTNILNKYKIIFLHQNHLTAWKPIYACTENNIEIFFINTLKAVILILIRNEI